MLELPDDYTYEQGIEEATARGFIEGEEVRREHYSHRRAVTEYNTRFLVPIAAEILRLWPHKRSLKVLELGPGAGTAVSEISRVLPDATIHTCGLTAINPYLRWQGRFAGQRRFCNAVQEIYNALERPLNAYDPPPRYMPDDFLKVQREGRLQIFELLRCPFIDRQWLGYFPDAHRLDERYDFIYDVCGPNFQGQSERLTRATYELLSPDGVICLNSSSMMIEMTRGKAAHMYVQGYTLIANPGNFLFPHIESHTGAGEWHGGNFAKVAEEMPV